MTIIRVDNSQEEKVKAKYLLQLNDIFYEDLIVQEYKDSYELISDVEEVDRLDLGIIIKSFLDSNYCKPKKFFLRGKGNISFSQKDNFNDILIKISYL